MRKTGWIFCVGVFLISFAGRGQDELEKGFASPPDSARMWTWWFWLGDKVDRESITSDLEALKAQGLAGVTVYSLSGPGVLDKGPNYMSPEWVELFKHTVKEADRLRLGVSVMLCSGWNLGGPWIKPELACKRHVHSELSVSGPRLFKGKLPQPAVDKRFYRDVAVQAFPITASNKVGERKLTASSAHEKYPVGNAADGDLNSFWVSNGERPNEGPSTDKPEWLLFDLGESRAVKRVTIAPRPGYGPREAELQTATDLRSFTTVKSFSMEKEKPLEVELPDRPVRYVRLFVTGTWAPTRENVQVCEFTVDGLTARPEGLSALMALKALSSSVDGTAPTVEINEASLRPLPPGEGDPVIDKSSMVDLTARCDADGQLVWDVPAGEWKILRTGYTLTGAMTSCSSPTGEGLEGDPLDPAVMDLQFANAAVPLIRATGALEGKVFRSVQIDSWEINHPNWTENFLADFERCRGYDPRPYLPTLGGHVVDSAETTDRFLYDYRKTLGDLVAENYFGRLSTLAQAQGLFQQSEAGGVCCPKAMAMDALKNLGQCAIPMGEFWQDGTWVEANQNKNGKQTASAAHLYGKRIAAAEAFTSFLHWTDSPASLKPTADRAFCEGFNQFFIFSSATRSGEGFPGTEYYAGTYFTRKITWWNQARCFSDYIARCSHLLQQGLFVADVLFYNGDGCPNYVPPKHVDPSLGFGYDYDVCNTEILLARLSVKDGRIVLPDGLTYRLLVLPERSDMPVDVLAKLKALVAAGMTLVGPRPEHAAGLKDYPQCDGQVRAMADELWGDCDGKSVKEHAFGKGRVVWGKAVRDVLSASGVGPDFAHDGAADANLDWIHRRANEADIYFIANRNARAEKAVCTFRVCGKQPEIWDPVTGLRRDAAAFSPSDTAVSVPLEFSPCGSQFVVFRRAVRPGATGKAGCNFPEFSPVLEIKGAWTVKFDARWGGPESAEFPELTDWTTRPEEGIRYYSGKATYVKTFELAEAQCANKDGLHLDLGDLNAVAEVRLNGQALGILWLKPYRVAIGKAVKAGANALEIDVVNLWPNRLMGDGKLPMEKRYTQTNIDVFYKGEHPLLPSGLLGPVRVLADVNLAAENAGTK